MIIEIKTRLTECPHTSYSIQVEGALTHSHVNTRQCHSCGCISVNGGPWQHVGTTSRIAAKPYIEAELLAAVEEAFEIISGFVDDYPHSTENMWLAKASALLAQAKGIK